MLIVNLLHSVVTYMWQHGPAAITGGILGVASTIALIRFIPGLRRFIHQNRLTEPEKRCQELEDEKVEIKKEIQAQIEGITKSADLVWHQTPLSDIPPFRFRQTGDPPIVAIVNLKGGVGKTTLSANIAATYCSQGRRALLVDLDYQGSLTLLCLSTGIIANRAHNAAKGLCARQRRIWESLGDTCRSAWGEPIHAFSTVVPQSAHFEHAANRKEFAALADLSPVFKDLFNELERRFPTSRQSNQHEGIRIPLSA